MVAFVFKIIRPIIFSVFKKGSLPQSRKFSTIKETLHNQGDFPQSRKNSTVKENFPQSRNFSTVVEILHNQRTFPPSRHFSTVVELFYKQRIFPQLWKFSANKNKKGFVKAKILDSFNTKSHAKILVTI